MLYAAMGIFVLTDADVDCCLSVNETDTLADCIAGAHTQEWSDTEVASRNNTVKIVWYHTHLYSLLQLRFAKE